jgi:hypothetical protein
LRTQSRLARPKNIIDSIRTEPGQRYLQARTIERNEHGKTNSYQRAPSTQSEPCSAMMRNTVRVISEPYNTDNSLVKIQYNLLQHKGFYLPQMPE